MKLFLSSYRLGNSPEAFSEMVAEGGQVAVIENAKDSMPPSERSERLAQQIEAIESLGLKASELDLRNHFGKKLDAKRDLANHDAVWVCGGNVFLLRRAMRDSGFDEAIQERIKNEEIVYGGYSAGSCVLSPSLRGIELVDDSTAVEQVYGKEVVWEGLGLIPFSIAPHYHSEHPEAEAIEKVVTFFEQENIPYKAVRDGQAIVFNGSEEKLIG